MEPVIPSAQTHLEFGNLTSLYICIHQNFYYVFILLVLLFVESSGTYQQVLLSCGDAI
jgi:hypothetical protein